MLCLRLQKKFKRNEEINDPARKPPQKQKGPAPLEPVSIEELRSAEIEIVKAVQKEAFPREITFLQAVEVSQDGKGRTPKKGPMRKTSPIRRLDPFKDQDGIIRVGGRIRHADVPYDEKHPVILPKKGHVTELVIRHHRMKNRHQGCGITHAGIRASGVWIMNGNSAVGHHIAKCVTCQRY